LDGNTTDAESPAENGGKSQKKLTSEQWREGVAEKSLTQEKGPK